MIQLYIALAVLAICLYYKYKCSYWTRRKVDGPAPLPIFGNLFEFVAARRHFGEIFEEMYRLYPNAAYVGFYKVLNTPAILIRDLELVKEVLVSSFQHFNENDFKIDDKIDPLLARNPFTQAGAQWKVTRGLISPNFGAQKVRSVFPIMKNVAENFVEYIDSNNKEGADFEAKDICAKYTVDVVASCAFGIDGESFTNPHAEFHQMGRDIFRPSFLLTIRTMMSLFIPSLNNIFRIPFIPKDVDEWFRSTIKHIVKERNQSEVKKRDLFQSVFDILKEKGDVKEDDIVGHSVTFLTEGYETSSILMTYFMFELASNQDVQKKVQQEIDLVLKENNGELCDEGVNKLVYMDQAINETLRVHSPVFTMSKICTKAFTLPPQYSTGTGSVTIEPGTSVFMCIPAIHTDPEYYPNPFKYDPDRFSEENKQTRHKYAFLGFGEGPRICLGMKFGLSQSKIGIATLLSKYTIVLSKKQILPLTCSKKTFALTPENGIWLNFIKRK